jgi:4-methoxybenzoate monooxygenase (O-demethylating)
MSGPVQGVGNGCPVMGLDPFSAEFLDNPYPFHEQLREAGPVVWLERYECWGMARDEQVRATLADWQTFCSSAGVGLSNFRSEPPWRPPSLILEADPPLHTRTRGVVTRILSGMALRQRRGAFARAADELVERLVASGSFDAVTDLAEAYPLKVFPDWLGLPTAGRENLLPYGNMVFNAFGPRNARLTEAMVNAQSLRDWIMAQCSREALSPGGLGAQVYAAVDAGELAPDEAPIVVRSFLSAGLDTTVNGLAAALFCFARHPDQWRLLREKPALARQAFDEVVRFESPVQTFFRTTTREVEVAGVRLGDNDKVLLFLAAANRDPRKWENPDTFDITRRAAGHVGFGAGIHECVGQAVARMEAEMVLTALARRVEAFEIAGEPKRRLNNTLRSLASLPIRVRAACD